MRRGTTSRRLIVTLLAFLLPGIVNAQHLPVPGPGLIFPASDSPGLSTLAPETFDPPPPRGFAEDIWQAKEEAAWVSGLPPGYIQHDAATPSGTGAIQPLGQLGIQQEGYLEGDAPALSNNFNGISYTGWVPPDPVLAAGPNNLVLVTNGSVTIRDKTGALVASTSLESFFSSVRASGENAFDPKVVFDTGSSRFFLAAVGRISNTGCTAGNCVSHFFLGVSKSSNPASTGSSDWYFYNFDATLDGSTATTNWADFPGLGVDGNVVVLTANMFSFSSSSFQKAKIRIFDKSVLITGGSVTWTDFVDMLDPSTGLKAFTFQPALTFGNPGTFFLVHASRSSVLCDLIVWGIENTLSSPTLSSSTATASGTCANPPDAEQLGGGTPLDTGDKRLYNSVYRNNSLWTAQSIQMNFGSGNVSAIRWVEIDVASWSSSVSFIQDATFGADGIWYFYPNVMADASSNLAIVLARSSTSEYGSVYYTGRQGAEAASTLQPSELLKAGAANYTQLDSLSRNRWGDYLGIGLDPSDGSFWILGEYAVASNQWGTWVGNFSFSNPVATLTSLSPSSATAGGAGFTLTVNGSNFLESSVVRWNGSDRTTTFVNSTQVKASIPSSDIATAGTAQVTVFNPSPGGGTSNALTFTINNQTFTLTLSKSGSGSGTVTSSPAGISCGSTCSASFDSGTSVTLTATPSGGSVFAGWSGGGCSGTGTCTVTVNADTTVTATFNASSQTFTLQTTLAGSASGTVTSSPAGINCGSDCSEVYAINTSVTLTASAGSGASFKEWGGACNGTSTTCTITMSAAKSATATFSKIFTDDPITSQSTLIKAVHITDLRQAINTLRSNNGLSSFTFTDSTLTAGATQVRKVHLTDLRTALNGVYDAKSQTRPTYTDATITAGSTVIKKAHIAEIRSNVKAVE